MVVSPIGDVVIVPFNIVDFVLGFDGTVLGEANVDPGSILAVGIVFKTGVDERLVGAIDAYTAGSGSFFVLFLFSVFGFLEAADASRRRAKIAQVYTLNFTLSFKKLGPIF